MDTNQYKPILFANHHTVPITVDSNHILITQFYPVHNWGDRFRKFATRGRGLCKVFCREYSFSRNCRLRARISIENQTHRDRRLIKLINITAFNTNTQLELRIINILLIADWKPHLYPLPE